MISKAEAIAIMKSGLGKAELELVASYTAPLYWVRRDTEGRFSTRNGSAFLLNAGAGLFGVTANHVLEAFETDRAQGVVVAVQLGHELSLDFHGKNAIIDRDSDLDLATFKISESEVLQARKTVLTNYRPEWPPPPPTQGRGIYYCGFPEVETAWMSKHDISFGIVGGGGIATSVSDIDVSTLIERAELIDIVGKGQPTENYKFSGISGSPMLAVIEYKGMRLWALAGVIYQGPNPSTDENEAIAGLEIIRARRADFICPDGKLDKVRWTQLNPTVR